MARHTCPVPNSFPQSKENQEYSYKFFITTTDKQVGDQADQALTSGKAPDGHGQFEPFIAQPINGAGEPNLGFGRSDTFGQTATSMEGILERGKDLVNKVSNGHL